jgi:homoserine O-acetyltransferase
VEFPAISTADQARALLLLLNRLGVRRVHLLVGASYGGNVAQQLAVLLGERLRHLVLLCAVHQASQFGLALRQVQRTILDLGDDADTALALARSLAVLGYRTPEGIETRFGSDVSGGEVSSWLDHHGAKFVARFDAAAYRLLSASIDAHRIDPAMIYAPTVLLAVREDLIVPLSLAREYAKRAPRCELIEISSPYGHDAFLKEEHAVADLLRAALEHAE